MVRKIKGGYAIIIIIIGHTACSRVAMAGKEEMTKYKDAPALKH